MNKGAVQVENDMSMRTYVGHLREFLTGKLIINRKIRTHQGGHVTTRILMDPETNVVVEEVELYCNTLKFAQIEKPNARVK